MRRRNLFALGATAAAAAISSCAKRAPLATPASPTAGAAPSLFPGRLVRPLVDPSRVTRVTVGLRPYRPQGFRVARQEYGNKLVIHNYGHGGGGMTLSWGSAEIAVQLLDPLPTHAAVLGCGVMGLSTARLLQQRGVAVTIYTKDLPPETTSNWSGAQWWPTSTHDADQVDDAYRRDFVHVTRRAYRLMQNYLGDSHGVTWRPNYFVSDEPFRDSLNLSPQGPLLDTQPQFRDLGPGQHSLPWAHLRSFQSMMIEPNRYLRALLAEFFQAGGKVISRELRSFADNPEPITFNCLGLGARTVAGDTSLLPIRGQLVVLLPQAGLDYNLLTGGYYMFPRQDGVLLGGTFDRGVESLDPDPAITARILAAHQGIAAKV